MEIKIGVQHAGREIVLESTQTPAEVGKAVATAVSDGSLLQLEDEKGRVVVIPGAKIAYVEIGATERGRVGFAARL
ncbi:MAG: DUF3107 domain-containing protein [Actinomycetota bacterium]|nr:MAG: DUF3107 domain-containing protein [Actinomycetota bacterium]